MKRRQFIKTVMALGTVAVCHRVGFAQEKVYLNVEQALKVIFAKSGSIVQDQKQLTDAQLADLEKACGVRINKAQNIYRGVTNGATDGYALIVNEIGKDQYITFIVGISLEFKVQRVALMVFRETRGAEVNDARFTNQFRGKSKKDRLLVGSDIIGITGATLSSRAFCRGTKKALLICETFYR